MSDLTPDPSLAAIDRQLVRLLGQRLQHLQQSDVHSPDAIPDAIPEEIQAELQHARVPPFVWRSVVSSCTAALATEPLHRPDEPTYRITIVGGTGMMGQFFQQRFVAAGHEVQILGRRDWDRAAELLGDVDLALVCVPIHRTLDLIRDTAEYLPATATLADITSIKAPIVRTMLDAHPGPVVGLHPMFGPGVDSFLSQKVVVCPGRDRPSWQWLVELMVRDGGDLVDCSPEEHDGMMVTVQAIRHFATVGLGVFLADEGIDIRRSLDLSSPIYRVGIDMVSRLFGQDASLYADIMLANGERRQAIARLAETFGKLSALVDEKDRAELIARMENASRCFGEETDRAVRESDRLIEAASIFLAADRVRARSQGQDMAPDSQAMDME